MFGRHPVDCLLASPYSLHTEAAARCVLRATHTSTILKPACITGRRINPYVYLHDLFSPTIRNSRRPCALFFRTFRESGTGKQASFGHIRLTPTVYGWFLHTLLRCQSNPKVCSIGSNKRVCLVCPIILLPTCFPVSGTYRTPDVRGALRRGRSYAGKHDSTPG